MTSYENGVDFSPAVENAATLPTVRPEIFGLRALRAFLHPERIRAIAQRIPTGPPRKIAAGFALGLFFGFLIAVVFGGHSALPAYIQAQENADDHDDDARALLPTTRNAADPCDAAQRTAVNQCLDEWQRTWYDAGSRYPYSAMKKDQPRCERIGSAVYQACTRYGK